jgi:8-oxo-dGTP pyrophosphatase MutT (NUDIX family)
MPKLASTTLILDRGKVLSVSRLDDHNDIGLPGGKVDPGETCEAAAIRETLEETGVKVLSLIHVFECDDGTGYYVHTFLVTEWEGTPRARESSVVAWVEPDRLMDPDCSFREFNRLLFKTVGLL